MRTLLFSLILFLSFNILPASEASLSILKNNKFTSGALTDSFQENDVWVKNYRKKSPVWRLFFPGGGQLYNGQYLKAGLFLGGEIVYLTVGLDVLIAVVRKTGDSILDNDSNTFLVVLLPWMIIRMWGVIDAYTSAIEINRLKERDKNNDLVFLYYPKDGVHNVGFSFHF